MDPFPTVMVALTFAEIAGLTYRSRFDYWNARLEHFGFVYAFLEDTLARGVRQAHWNINLWTVEEAMQWRNSYISSSSAIAVAAAIFASVGLTSLQLPDLASSHWTTRAFLMSSMIFGVLSALVATFQLRDVAMLGDHMQIRLWLSRGRVKFSERKYNSYPYRQMPLESSIARSKNIELPQLLLGLAALFYTIGFGLYVLFLWIEQANLDPNGSRNTFIFYITIVGLFILYWYLLQAWQLLDNHKVENDFGMSEEGFIKSQNYQELEEALRLLQEVQSLDSSNWERRTRLGQQLLEILNY